MLKNIYNQSITLLNKLKRSDTFLNTDVWYKTMIDNVAWYRSVERGIVANDIVMGTYINVLIPFDERYIPYMQWKRAGEQNEHYTISIGDYVVLGDVDDIVDSSNIVKVMQKYGENACLVKHYNVLYDRFGAKVQLKIQGI